MFSMNWTKITKRKDRAGLTWAQIAREAEMPPHTPANWISGRVVTPDPHKLKAWMDAFERLERRAG